MGPESGDKGRIGDETAVDGVTTLQRKDVC